MKKLIVLLLTSFSLATVINIPDDYSTIQEGIDASVNSDTVLVQPNTYYENINFNGHNIILGSLFLTTSDTSYISQTIIDGGGISNVVRIEDLGGLIQLSGLSITNGNANGEYPYQFGGGILCVNSNPNIDHCFIYDNISQGSGGGLNISGSSMPIIENCRINNNTAVNNNSDGGGIGCHDAESITIIDSEITNNNAFTGGGLYSNSCDFNLTNVTISNNMAERDGGAGAFRNNSNLIFNNSNLSYNIAQQEGGAILIREGSLELNHSLVSYNQSNWNENNGGAIHAETNANLYINNSTIYENSKSGIYLDDYTIDTIISNSIIYGNTEEEISTRMYGTNVSLTYSDVDYYYCNDNYAFVYCEGNIIANPQFVASENDDFSLEPTSPCIDMGNPDLDNNGLTWENDPDDQDPDGTRLDIGAYYYHQESGCTDPLALNYDPETSISDNCECTYLESGDYSLQFDGVNGDYVSIPDSESLRPETITIGAWVKSSDFGILDNKLVAKANVDDAYDGQYTLYISDRIPIFNIKRESNCGHGGFYSSAGSEELSENVWHFILGTWDGNISKIYVDGLLVGENSNIPSGGIDNCSGGNLRFGYWWNGDPDLLNGEIDNISIWNRAIDAEEVMQYYENDIVGSEDGLVGFWNFDEGEGNIVHDRSCYQNHGTIYGADWFMPLGCTDPLALNYNPDANLDDGSCEYDDNANYSLDFDGFSSFVDISDTDILDMNLSDFTIEAWVLNRNENDEKYIIGKMDGTRNGYGLVKSQDGELISTFRKEGIYSDAVINVVSDPIELNTWYHITGVLDRDVGAKLYINGELVDEVFDTKLENVQINNSEILAVGKLPGYGAITPFDGLIDGVKIWNQARTSEQVQTSFLTSTQESEDGLVGYWNFNEGSGNILQDLSGNINNGTINAAAWSNNVPVLGCTDSDALNYDPNADFEDGTCTYLEGCTDPLALNFNPEAIVDDGSCEYVLGCTDPLATNFNPDATIDDGSCTYGEAGCNDETAYNFNENAQWNDGSCIYYGDINADGSINVVDVIAMVGFVLEFVEPTPEEILLGDLYPDGVINIYDIVGVVSLILTDPLLDTLPLTEVTLIQENNSLKFSKIGSIAGIQIEYEGDFESLLEGWMIEKNETTILMVSMDGSDFDKLHYSGDLKITSCTVVDWELNKIKAEITVIPDQFSLKPAYPNPFNPVTTINYAIPHDAYVVIKAFDIRGKEVAVLVNGMIEEGFHEVVWDASKLSSGMYFVRMTSVAFKAVQKIVFVK
jgi:hypothetical protein